MIVFDIETGPLPLEQLQTICAPFDPSSLGNHPGQFDPASVKLGLMKDQAKIQAKIEECRVKHEAAVAEYERKLATGEQDYWDNVQATAALCALRGEVLAIGYLGKQQCIDCQASKRTEADLLVQFWSQVSKCKQHNRPLVGFNIREFDIPFLVRRSWINQVDVPEIFKGRYLDSIFVDLRDIWLCGAYRSEGSLDSISRALGCGAKSEDCSGADFARLFRDESTRQQALDYLANDLAMTAALAERLGVS